MISVRRLTGQPERVSVEFGGGFYHYGYRLQRASDTELELICYGEYPEDDQLLMALPKPETDSADKAP